jgi:hypothetical protein
MAIVNWIVVIMAAGVFFYSMYKIVNRGKIATEIAREIGVLDVLNAKRKMSPNTNTSRVEIFV